jgi:hypothetical protein
MRVAAERDRVGIRVMRDAAAEDRVVKVRRLGGRVSRQADLRIHGSGGLVNRKLIEGVRDR